MDNNRKLVIGVIGTQNTGKTTFIKDIIKEDNSFAVVGCDYRKKIAEAGLSINRNGNLESQKIIMDTLVEQLEIIKGLSDGSYITDRSPIDAYVYTVYLYRHNPELGITQEDLNEMLDKVKESIQTYTNIIYIDLDKCGDVDVVDDKFRDTNLEYRKEIDSLFKETIEILGDRVKSKLNSNICGSREKRVHDFLLSMDIIRSLDNNMD